MRLSAKRLRRCRLSYGHDPSAQRDVAKFCDFLGHELLEHHQDGRVFSIVKKAG